MKTSAISGLRPWLLGIGLLLSAPAFWACNTTLADESNAIYQAALDHQNQAIDDTIIQAYLRRHQIRNYNRTASGVYWVPLATGTGMPITTGKQVSVNYTGRFVGPTTESTTFDSGSNFLFRAGYTSLIPG